jgi:DedD protein
MDSALKQRLLGAAVLIALAIIFVPMFLSNTPPKQDNSTQNLNIPPAPERNFETRNLAVDTPSGATPTPQAVSPPASANAPATGSTTTPGSSKVADSNRLATVTTGAPPTFEASDDSAGSKPVSPAGALPKPAVATATPAPTPPPAPAAQADGRFLVNLGIYSDAGHANALVDKVKKLGYPAFAENTDFQGKSAQRVRVGPYADRAAAEGVRLKIKQADAKVPSSIVEATDTTPVTPAPAATKPAAAAAAATSAAPTPTPNLPANRAGGYAVQLGAFKSEAEANKLRDRLRVGGVASFVDKSGDGDQALWKVRAGPYADRGGADTALASIKQKFQITGLVKTLP